MVKKKERLDIALVNQQLCPSRALAQRLIRAGKVKVKEQIIDKPGTLININDCIELQAEPPFVSRGGEKLAKAIDQFQVPIIGRICLDGGISTGGFTDCLLQRGAKQVYGVDVGYGQVAWKLRQDERLILRERTNLRYLTWEQLYQNQAPADLGVMDLSFISLTKVLPQLWKLLAIPRDLIVLVKPQFEVGKGKVGKQGVVKDFRLQAEVINQVLEVAIQLGWQYQNLTFSPITGPAGNIEYLLWLSQNEGEDVPHGKEIEQLTKQAHLELNS